MASGTTVGTSSIDDPAWIGVFTGVIRPTSSAEEDPAGV